MTRSRLLAKCSAALLACTLVACGGKGAAGPDSSLQPYEGKLTKVFDDTIEPASVGLDLDKTYAAAKDPDFYERVQSSEGVLQVRVTTVTTRSDGPDTTYILGMSSKKALFGVAPDSGQLSVEIRKGNESVGIVRSLENRIVGMPFIVCYRRFRSPDGGAATHFHLLPDTDEVRRAVDDAVAMKGM